MSPSTHERRGRALDGGHALLAGGGTGGHVFPALAVAEELAGRGWRVTFAGRPESLEARLAAGRGLDFLGLRARPLVGRGAPAAAVAVAVLAASAWRARGALRRLGIDAALGTGGYACAPGVLGARLAGRPAMLLEPNARPGAANRWLSRWAAECAVAHEEAGAGLRCPVVVTGVPVRRAFFEVPAEHAPGPPRLLVLGGSQGSRDLNLAVPAALARAAGGPAGLSVVHQAGRERVAEASDAWARARVDAEVQVVAFLDDVAAELARAHLVVSRAGAVTLAELCAAGRPSLLVPLALAGGHQEDNARALERAGAARRVEPGAAAGEALAPLLAPLLAELLADRGALAAMGRAARGLARADAASLLADRLTGLAGGRAA